MRSIGLTPKHARVAELAAEGYAPREIAPLVRLSVRQVSRILGTAGAQAEIRALIDARRRLTTLTLVEALRLRQAKLIETFDELLGCGHWPTVFRAVQEGFERLDPTPPRGRQEAAEPPPVVFHFSEAAVERLQRAMDEVERRRATATDVEVLAVTDGSPRALTRA